MSIAQVIALLLLVSLPFLLWWFAWRVRRGHRYAFRRIPAYEKLRGLLGAVTEGGKKVHVSLGTAGVGGDQTAVVSAGLAVLNTLADQGAALGSPPTVTVADPTLMIVAQDVLYRAHEQVGRPRGYRATDVQLVAPDPTAYAVGAQDTIADEDVAANVMVGSFGEEYLLMGEAGAQRGIVQVVGSNDVNALPFMTATTEHVLLGEEAFAAGAYLTGRPEHAASLRLQDVLRVAIVAVIVVGVAIKTLLGW